MARSKNLNYLGKAAVAHHEEMRQYIFDAQIANDKARQESHRLIHDGLLQTLKRHDENWQENLNNCKEYPFTLRIGNEEEMKKVFRILSDMIENAIHISDCTCSDISQSGLPNVSPMCQYCESMVYKYEELGF
jgi:hypothetical protein